MMRTLKLDDSPINLTVIKRSLIRMIHSDSDFDSPGKTWLAYSDDDA